MNEKEKKKTILLIKKYKNEIDFLRKNESDYILEEGKMHPEAKIDFMEEFIEDIQWAMEQDLINNLRKETGVQEVSYDDSEHLNFNDAIEEICGFRDQEINRYEEEGKRIIGTAIILKNEPNEEHLEELNDTISFIKNCKKEIESLSLNHHSEPDGPDFN